MRGSVPKWSMPNEGSEETIGESCGHVLPFSAMSTLSRCNCGVRVHVCKLGTKSAIVAKLLLLSLDLAECCTPALN